MRGRCRTCSDREGGGYYLYGETAKRSSPDEGDIRRRDSLGNSAADMCSTALSELTGNAVIMDRAEDRCPSWIRRFGASVDSLVLPHRGDGQRVSFSAARVRAPGQRKAHRDQEGPGEQIPAQHIGPCENTEERRKACRHS